MRAKAGWFAFDDLSLKKRLGLIFLGFLALGILCAGALLLAQYRVAMSTSEISLHWNQQMGSARELRQGIGVLYRKERLSKLGQSEIASYRKMIDLAESTAVERSTRQSISRIRESFEQYAKVANSADFEAKRFRWQEVAALTEALVERQEHHTMQLAAGLQEKQRNTILLAIGILVAFLLLVALAGMRSIGNITQPLEELTRFVDEVDLEDNLPLRLPTFRSRIPEVAFVGRSFERLLVRLRGYRALNFRRLLIEKRRADIIAASISDGIFLLRGEEILYVNPVAERILNIGPMPLWAHVGTGRIGLGMLSDLTRAHPERTESPVSRGAKAVLNAVQRSMPVEFTLEEDDRKQQFLIRAYPISMDLIEQVEHSAAANSEIIDKFQANTLVVAQDVTLVKESQNAKGHFLGTLSHEVKTPVTSLTMAIRLLDRILSEKGDESQKNLIRTCVEDVDRLRHLIDDFLTVSRFDTLTQRIEFKEVDLVKLLKHTIQNFLPSASEKNINLTTKNLSSMRQIPIPIDPNKITWAISNLLINAIRHTPRGGNVWVQIDAAENRVEVRVRDSGPGIEITRQSRIFEKFSPFYDIRVARSGSAGVGLSIAREIVVAHGGRIWVNSEPGAGAEFCFTLPMKRNAPDTSKGDVELLSKCEAESKHTESKGVNSGATASG